MIDFKSKPTLDSFHWNTVGWESQPTTDGTRAWVRASGDVAVQKFVWEEPTGIPRNWRDLFALRDYVRTHPSRQVTVLSTDLFQIAGITLAQYLQKEYMPEPSRGYAYSGVITLPFTEFYCNYYFTCAELGTTGIRESVLASSRQIQIPAEEAVSRITSQQTTV